MISKLDRLQEESSKQKLDDSERQALRESLMRYVDQNPIKVEPQVSSSEKASPYFSKWLIAGLLAALILLVGGGVSFAAERSLPGDLLYPVKIGMTEKVRGFLAVSDKSKAELEVSLAGRRLDEAEKLQSQSKLSTDVKAKILRDFSKHVQSLGVHVEHLAAQKDLQGAKEESDKFETTLAAHGSILPILSLVGSPTVTATTSGSSTSSFSPGEVIITPQVEASIKKR